MNKLIIFSLLLIFQINFSQQAKIFKIKKYELAILSDSLKENSGLFFYDNELYTFNDGGNSSELFHIDALTGKILRKFPTNLQNTDWEAVTHDGLNLYIGDFGNNAGNRKDLKIYKMAVESVVRASSSNNALHASPTTITFYYPDQADFSKKNLKNNYDAEAIVFLNGKLHLFTKEWKSKSTTHYTIDPQNFERQQAEKVETFQTNFLVTDASFHRGKLYLIGYTKKTEVYLQIFEVSDDGTFFTKPSTKYYLGSTLSLSQIEGIAVNDEGIYISGENFASPLGIRRARIYHIPIHSLDE